MVFGFSGQRRQLLEAELMRISGEMRALGVERFYLAGELATESTTHRSELELVIVRAMEEPFHRRPDFFVTHLRPQVGTRFWVYTPDEFEALQGRDPLLRRTLAVSDAIHV